MQQFTLIIGLNDKNTKKQELDTISCYKIVNNLLLQYVNGATIYQAQGIYKHENSQVVIENSLKIDIIDASRDIIEKIASQIKTLLNQESVVIIENTINSELF